MSFKPVDEIDMHLAYQKNPILKALEFRFFDPFSPTCTDRTEVEKEIFLIFSLFVCGKKAKQTRLKLFNFWLSFGAPTSIFQAMSSDWEKVADMLRVCKVGQYSRIEEGLYHMVWSLGNKVPGALTLEDLLGIPGIGMKSAKFFLLHNGDERHAVLDTHILRWLKNNGVPHNLKATPSSRRKYELLEKDFLARVPEGMKTSEFDFQIWKEGEASNESKQSKR